ncbi:MAG: SBBP repeat-containing protein, partial [Candidatus Binatia bacterium]
IGNVPAADDVFVARFDPALSGAASLIYSTYLGGNDNDTGLAVAVDAAGNAYVTGKAESTNFPLVNHFQSHLIGGNEEFNAFVSKLSSDGSTLVYSSYLGGANTQGMGIAVNSAGNAVLTGSTTSTAGDFPVVGALQAVQGGLGDAFLTVLSADGSAVVYSTFIGGSIFDEGRGVALDSAGNAYVTGGTFSDDFPITGGAFQTTKNPSGPGNKVGFATKIALDLVTPASTRVYSTFLGNGVVLGTAIDVDSSASAYVAGTVNFAGSGFATTGAFQTTSGGGGDGFVLKLDAGGTQPVYSTFLGGSGIDMIFGIDVDASGKAYVAGTTSSSDFPTERALQATHAGGGNDAFVAKINANGSGAVYSTCLGGSQDDQGKDVAVDSSGKAYVAGFTNSVNFPVAGAAQASLSASSDAFVASISDAGCQQASECDDGDPCTDDACDPGSGGCLHTANNSCGNPCAAPPRLVMVNSSCVVGDPCEITFTLESGPNSVASFAGTLVLPAGVSVTSVSTAACSSSSNTSAFINGSNFTVVDLSPPIAAFCDGPVLSASVTCGSAGVHNIDLSGISFGDTGGS